MHPIDWAMIILPILALMGFSLWTRRFVRGAADHIAGGRLAGRYLLANARGEAGSGLTNTVSHFEIFLVAGFITIFWGWLSVPVAILVATSGFVIYRYRQTRCLTLAEYLEKRYSPGFRLFMGGLIFLSGALNYAIFPYVSSQFFIFFLDLPRTVGPEWFQVPTFIAIMAVYMPISAAMIIFGGQVNLMVSDCLEGIFSHAAYIVIIIVVLLLVPWTQISDMLCGSLADGSATAALAVRPGASPVDPMDAFDTRDFNFWFVAIGILTSIYLTMAWQGGHGFNSAARTPHESRMGVILGQWRQFARVLLLVVLTLSAMAFLRHPDQQDASSHARERIAAIAPDAAATAPVGSQAWMESPATTSDQKKHTVTVALSEMLPPGIKGLLLLILIMGLFAGDGAHMHSWSSVLVQDVLLQLRRRRGLPEPSPDQHLRWLRLAIVGTAGFAFLFSAVIMPRLDMPIWFWWGITGAIFNAGAGAVIIGGFYWRRGSTAGAWAAMATGAILAVISTLGDFLWKDVLAGSTILGWTLPTAKPYSMPWVAFATLLLSAATYVVVSLLRPSPQQPLPAAPAAAADGAPPLPWWSWRKIAGIDKDFTRGDTAIAAGVLGLSLTMVAVLIAALGWHWATKPFQPDPTAPGGFGLGLLSPELAWGPRGWAAFWLIWGLVVPGVIAVATLVWFTIGGIGDIRAYFRALTARPAETPQGQQSPPQG
ncbi:MAG: hypothetical protein RLZZ127_711 [Planctomycetota bacterium]|jgi:SSS family solute:Na+ symporter